jgi:NAD(P)-dependent dehydrogenase (short-subunit alcohol dehydrogenase family)
MKTLKNQVALITGASGGIGLATTKLFLEQGAKVMLADVDKKALEQMLADLNSPNVSYIKTDITHREANEQMVAHTMHTFGRLDIFMANAGIEGATVPIQDYPEAIYDRVQSVNTKGVWMGCKAVIPVLTDGGCIIITSSVAGLKGFATLIPYVMSKHAVTGLAKSLAIELAPRKIRVHSIHPGPVNNRMMRSIETQISPEAPEAVQEGFTATIPMGRYAENVEVARVALFLAQKEQSYLTGTQQLVDGGMVL